MCENVCVRANHCHHEFAVVVHLLTSSRSAEAEVEISIFNFITPATATDLARHSGMCHEAFDRARIGAHRSACVVGSAS